MFIASSPANVLPITASTSESPAGDSEAVENAGIDFRAELWKLLNPTVPQTELPLEQVNSNSETSNNELLEGDEDAEFAVALMNVPMTPLDVPRPQVEVNRITESGVSPLPTLQAATSLHGMTMPLSDGGFQRAVQDIPLTTSEVSYEASSQLDLEQTSGQASREVDADGIGDKVAATVALAANAQMSTPNIPPKSTESGPEESVEDVSHSAAASESDGSESPVNSARAAAATATRVADGNSGSSMRPTDHVEFMMNTPVDVAAARPEPAQREAIESAPRTGELKLPHSEASSGVENNDISVSQTSAEFPMTSNEIVATRSEDVARANMSGRIFTLAQETKSGDMQSVVLRLSPPAVGDVFVRISRQRSKLNIELRTHSIDIASSLRGEHDQLMERLVQQGFERESVDISYSGSERSTQDVPDEWLNTPRVPRGALTEQQKKTDDMSFVA
ncbi:MAG: flagellar hook-length control protein FliK [Planctomycetaceae bacterium]|nr:flagellar hook-length control protein FliK [Planctomycetaceae bacterium]MCB9953231.1 flagellar hook-length control protein FliK [Planctomycetaceae bacterium]